MADVASDFWHSVFLCGTEWANFAEIYERPWDFDHLHEDLVAGTLAERGQPVYIFGATEPQLLDFEDGTPATIVAIPTLTAVSCGVAPPERLGINSVQMREEEIVPMRRHKMGWVPYFPDGEAPKKGADGIPIHFLHCNERAANLKNMSEARREAYEYCIPYIFLPHLAKFEYTTVVSVLRNVEGKQLAFDFDWKFDDLDEFTEEILKNHNLPASAADEVKAGINEEVAAQKATLRAEKAAMNAEIEAIPEEDREALKDIYVVKYYPQNKAPNLDGFKSKFTNRYYPSANEVKPPVKKKKFAWGKKK